MSKPLSKMEGRAKMLKEEAKDYAHDTKRKRTWWAREARRAHRRALKRRLRKENE